jgi:O-succinylbenzoic acid--CoA ligase
VPGLPPDPGMPEWLGRRASVTPDRLALVAGALRWSFRELDAHATRAARQLAARDVTEGVRVGVILRSGALFAVLAHALARLGAIMVPLNVRLTPPELAWQLADSHVEVVISDHALAPLTAEAVRNAPHLRHVEFGEPDASGWTVQTAGPYASDSGGSGTGTTLRDRVRLADVQGIVYTSATSGRPKGVLLTYGNHWWNAVGSALHLGLHGDDRWLVPIPLYHIGGLAVVWRGVIYGITVVIHDAFDPEAVNREIDENGVTLVSVVGTMLRRILEARGARPFPRTLRCVLLGGGPAGPALLRTCLKHGVPVAPTYGLTEAASQVATAAPEAAARKPGSVGKPLYPADVRIARDGGAAAAGEVGEILVRGPTVMLGYAGRPRETAHALRDGWLHTGDLGYLDDEGDLYVVDRRNDLIITGGENVYPAEVESVLLEHSALADACVVGLPDPEWGQMVAALVTLRPGSCASEGEVKAFCASRLARYKIPVRVWLVDALPRSPGGKLIRRAVRERAAEILAAERSGPG